MGHPTELCAITDADPVCQKEGRAGVAPLRGRGRRPPPPYRPALGPASSNRRALEHNALASRFGAIFGNRVPRGCRSYSPDQRFWIAGTARGRYSDGSIICGKPEYAAHDGQAATNPLVVVEVLSPISAGDDDGDKRRDFQSLTTLQAYVIAAQDTRRVKVYRRNDRGDWQDQPDHYLDGAFELPGLTAPLTVDAIYDDILDAAGRSLLR